MDYEQKYKETLERAKDMLSYKEVRKEDMEYLFPELKESEDERVRKEILGLVQYTKGRRIGYEPRVHQDEMVTWLEKQCKPDKSLYIINNTPNCGISVYNEELKESEDEKIRKNCIHFLELQKSHHASTVEIEECIAWLEKQTEHLENYDDEDILQRFSFYSYKDEPNIIYLSGLYVNAKHRNKGIGTKILTIADEVAARMGCNVIRLKTEIGGNAERLYRRNGYNTFKRDGNQVWLEKQGEQNFDYEHADIPQKDFAPIEPKTLDADKVIEWLNENVADFWESPCNPQNIINQFKKDFNL